MSLRVIHGKPGSGKTCYVVHLLFIMFLDWARYMLEHGEPMPRKLYTNIPLYVDRINEKLSDEIGTKVDLSEGIVTLEPSFFQGDRPGEYREWWNDFGTGGFIVIDEVHHYLPASLKKKAGGLDFAEKFTQYVSMHRHNQHDIILLSQHVDNVNVEVKKQIETIYEVLNLKSQKLPWPISIPLSDIDVVREAWGCPQQLAHIRRGVMEARRIVYDKDYDTFVLRPFLFEMYRSHTKSDEALDRPSLKLGRIGSLVWLARRHALRLVSIVIVFVTLFFMAKSFITEFPKALVSGLVSKTPQVGVSSSPSSATPEASAHGEPGHICNDNHVVYAENDVVIGLLTGGVITVRGIVRIDEHLTHEGERDFVQAVNLREGVIYLGSGRKIVK